MLQPDSSHFLSSYIQPIIVCGHLGLNLQTSFFTCFPSVPQVKSLWRVGPKDSFPSECPWSFPRCLFPSFSIYHLHSLLMMSLHGGESFSIIPCSCIVVSDVLSDAHRLVHLLTASFVPKSAAHRSMREKMAHMRREAEKRIKVHWGLPANLRWQERRWSVVSVFLAMLALGLWTMRLQNSTGCTSAFLMDSSLVTWSVVLC